MMKPGALPILMLVISIIILWVLFLTRGNNFTLKKYLKIFAGVFLMLARPFVVMFINDLLKRRYSIDLLWEGEEGGELDELSQQTLFFLPIFLYLVWYFLIKRRRDGIPIEAQEKIRWRISKFKNWIIGLFISLLILIWFLIKK